MQRNNDNAVLIINFLYFIFPPIYDSGVLPYYYFRKTLMNTLKRIENALPDFSDRAIKNLNNVKQRDLIGF